jgi:hypothetical protein
MGTRTDARFRAKIRRREDLDAQVLLDFPDELEGVVEVEV